MLSRKLGYADIWDSKVTNRERLFLPAVSGVGWLISYIVFRKKWQKIVFWIVAVFSALVFSFGHLPSIIYLVGVDSVNEIPMALLAEIIILNGSLSILAAYYFRKSGFLAAVGIHFWADIV